jgi:RNA polymerase sigma-70 factor (ECF subfamily)
MGATTHASMAPLPEGDERILHERLLAGDRTATAELAMAYLEPLIGWLTARNNPQLDPHLCTMAAGDALIVLMKEPERYDPARGRLWAYLRMSAQRKLQNLLRAERRHSSRNAALEAVEVSPEIGKYLWDEESDPARLVLAAEEESEFARQIPPVPASVQAGLTAQEEKVLELMRQRERRTAVYARVLGLAGLPPDQQRREVKRVKDRLAKRVQRARSDDGQSH